IAMPINLRRALKLKHIAGIEIDEQQGCARVADQIAEGIEITVAAKIRNRQHVAVDPNETRPAAAMRNIRAVGRPVAGPGPAGNEKSVGMYDGRCRRVIQMIQGFGASRFRIGRNTRQVCESALLNVLRAIAEALTHGDRKTPRTAWAT